MPGRAPPRLPAWSGMWPSTATTRCSSSSWCPPLSGSLRGWPALPSRPSGHAPASMWMARPKPSRPGSHLLGSSGKQMSRRPIEHMFLISRRLSRPGKMLTRENLADLQLAAYRIQVFPHLVPRRLSITATQHRQQLPVPLNSCPSRFRTAAIAIVDGQHLAETGKRGLQHPIPGRLRDCIVEGEGELIELVRLLDDLLRLINKLLERVPLLARRTAGSEGGHGWLDRALGIEQLLGANIEEVIGHSKPIGGVG